MTTSAGAMEYSGENIRLTPSGKFESIEEIGNLVIVSSTAQALLNQAQAVSEHLVPESIVNSVLHQPASRITGKEQAGAEQQIRLRDIATIRRVKKDPPSKVCRYDGKECIAIAISPRPNGNVVRMGEEVHQKANELMAAFPAGCELKEVTFQPDDVTVNLYKQVGSGEKQLVETQALNAGNNWSGTVPDQPRYAAGSEIRYTWIEDSVAGYEQTSYVANWYSTVITNRHETDATVAD